jgi:hypothetical protein
MQFRESTIRAVNNKGTDLRTRKCWLATSKVGTVPMLIYYLDKPVIGKYVRIIEENDRWNIKELFVDDINEVCVFLSR